MFQETESRNPLRICFFVSCPQTNFSHTRHNKFEYNIEGGHISISFKNENDLDDNRIQLVIIKKQNQSSVVVHHVYSVEI